MLFALGIVKQSGRTYNSIVISNILQPGSIPFTPGHGPFVICYYGTADGVNSLGVMTNCIGK